jgi:CheY-like chemotaxis protein
MLDLHLPDMNGFQLAEHVLSRNPKLPIILQSGNATERLGKILKRLCRAIREK